jgi:hypothetical protein
MGLLQSREVGSSSTLCFRILRPELYPRAKSVRVHHITGSRQLGLGQLESRVRIFTCRVATTTERLVLAGAR